MKFEKGQKVKHVKVNEIFEVVEDKGEGKVRIKDKSGIVISVLRENLVPVEGEKNERGSSSFNQPFSS